MNQPKDNKKYFTIKYTYSDDYSLKFDQTQTLKDLRKKLEDKGKIKINDKFENQNGMEINVSDEEDEKVEETYKKSDNDLLIISVRESEFMGEIINKDKNISIGLILINRDEYLSDIREKAEKEIDNFNNYSFLNGENIIEKKIEKKYKVTKVLIGNQNQIYVKQDEEFKIKDNKIEKKEDIKMDKVNERIKLKEEDQIDELKKREEEERIKKEEEERIKKEEEERIKKEEEERIKKEEEDKIKKEEEERRKKEEEEEKIKKEEEERRKKEEEEKRLKEQLKRKEKEKEFGICFNKESNDKINYIHIEVESENNSIEIYNLANEDNKGYKFIQFEKNKYFTICPFFIGKKSLLFGIRDSETKKPFELTLENSVNSHLIHSKGKKEYKIYIQTNHYNLFNIFNEPHLLEKNKIFLYLKKLYEFNYYNCEFYSIQNATSAFSFSDIIDKIMEIGDEHRLSSTLIKILANKTKDRVKIAKYLEDNKNTKFQNKNYNIIAPKIIIKFNNCLNKEENNDNIEFNNNSDDNFKKREKILCCNRYIINNIDKHSFPDNFIDKIKIDDEVYNKEQIKEKIENKKNNLKNDIENKIAKGKNIDGKDKIIIENEIKEMKSHLQIIEDCYLTEKTLTKIAKLDQGIKENIPMIIQGFTSAGKSYLSKYVLILNDKECETIVLSDHTSTEDLLGRDIIDTDNSISFCPGILLQCYTKGKTLILDEGDLAKPEVLSCILGSLTKDELNVCNKIYYRNDNYNIILTMNGESKNFNEKQRNILTSNILSKFQLIHFDEIEEEESENIFEAKFETCEF